MPPWLSIVAGGLVSVLITIGFNVYWDQKKQELVEDWEFRRYHANQIHLATSGLMEAFFAAKAEMYYLYYTLETLADSFTQLTSQADEIVRQQAGADLNAAEFERRKIQWLQPLQRFNQEQVTLRWNQHEQKAKELQAQAETHLSALQPLVPAAIFNELLALYAKLNTMWSWSLQSAQEQSKLYEGAVPELIRIRSQLMEQIELKLRKRNPSKN
jgi:hypothetical protein